MIQCVHERLRELAASGGGDGSAATASSSSAMDVDDRDPGTTPLTSVRFSEIDKDAMLTIAPSGLACSSTAEKLWLGVRASHGVRSGHVYYECTVIGNGISRVGWSTMSAHHEIGKDSHGYGYGGTGKKSYAGGFEDYGEKYGNNDVIGCYLNWTARTVSYSKNGKPLGVAFSINETLVGSVIFPAVVIKGGGISVNFGESPFRFPPPADGGAVGLAQVDSSEIVGALSKQAFAVTGTRRPLAVILEPARDLAEQVYQAILDMSRYISGPELSVALLVGGDDHKKQVKTIKAGVDIVVGTTGKIVDLVKSKDLDFSQVKFFILDEADRLIETDNLPGILQLYGACPGGGTGDNRLQVCFFSATLHSPAITDLAGKLCFNPTWVDLKGVDSVPDTVHHVVYRIDPVRDAALLTPTCTKAVTDDIHPGGLAAFKPDSNKGDVNSQLIKEIKYQVLLGIIDKFQMSQCMIFCRTNVDCDNLEAFLCAHGGGKKFSEKMDSGKEHAYSCCVLAGMRSMADRRRNLEAFKEGYVRFLLCTDVAARGIDIQGLPYVINMTLPDEAEHYIHRIGRVGRADRMGLAISLVATDGAKEKVWYHKCANRGKGCTNRKLTTEGGCTIW
jgi:ATP-dependent RNA helicase DDX1